MVLFYQPFRRTAAAAAAYKPYKFGKKSKIPGILYKKVAKTS
jgi:hypothetical protein